jgi:hypothetical protein
VWEKEVWPPSSPERRPLDYFVWGVTQLKVIAAPRNKTEDLTKKIKEVMGSLRFCTSIKAIIATDGDFIE